MLNPNLSGVPPLTPRVTGQFAGLDASLRDTSGQLEPYRGFTRNLRTGQNASFTSGYVVADPGGTSVPHSAYDPAQTEDFVRGRQAALLGPGTGHLGVFVDSKTVDTDVSRHFADPRSAFKAMRRRPPGGGVETEQKSGWMPGSTSEEPYIFNPYHPENMERISKALS